AGRYPAVLRGLARGGSRRAAGHTDSGPAGWAERLAGLAPDDARELLVELVRAQAAAVLGHASAQAVPAGRAFS
ncbi:acyl carrier protein, partial [Micromonospora sp. NBS 11-29]|uniref:acyl carrier protein n=1 Tax=Micromonospora sp. NBS 11-29 TaxID=1960879 RepID=UPI001593CC03